MKPRSSILLNGACASLGVLLMVALAGCNDSGTKASLPLATLTPISNCIVDSQNDVEIGGSEAPAGCQSVVLSPSSSNPASFGDIDVENGGTLLVTGAPGTSTASAPAIYKEREICVGPGGTVKYEKGTNGNPVNSKGKIVMQFIGDRGDQPTGNDPCAKQGFQKGIDVLAGGTLLMYGAKGVPEYDSQGDNIGGTSWTTLAAPAGSNVPGAKAPSASTTALYLTADVTKSSTNGDPWQKGDWIVVATTDYTPFHSEFVQIKDVHSGNNGVKGARSWVTLEQPLKYYHFGSLPPSPPTLNASCPNPFYSPPAITAQYQPNFLCNGANRNFGVDERAEVGLISRDIELTADTEPVTTVPPPATSSVHWGGEIMIHQGFDKVVIQGVRLSKFGKDQLGSYPIHFHQVGAIGGDQVAQIDADSVDHSYNKCVTIHATSNLKISDLVCARIVGHIFYEELNDQTVSNPSLDRDIVFDHDLGIGTSSNDFDIYAGTDAYGDSLDRAQMIKKYWWAGDYMTNNPNSPSYINYDAFNIPDTDNWKQWVQGSCFTLGGAGQEGFFIPAGRPLQDKSVPCPAGQYYVEPASGFWIQNPGTVLTNDAIAGCQGDGVAFWWVPPGNGHAIEDNTPVDMSTYELGEVKGDRASGCLEGYWGSGEIGAIQSQQLFPHAGSDYRNANVIATLDDITATHIRDRAVWLRPVWFVIKNGHFADDNRAVVLVSSGGIDGNAPGVWELLENSALIGESQDNVGRWGPCPTKHSLVANPGGGANITNPGWNYGCIDYSHPATGTAHSGEIFDYGYPRPGRNSFGYMIYDGPVRIFHDRFINYNYNKNWSESVACSTASTPSTGAFYRELDYADCAALKYLESVRKNAHDLGPPAPYEGDAALGWFDSNQNAYPVTTVSKELMWRNTNFRHQIYTEHVSVDQNFNDGDKNTAIVDEDGTLDGFGVQKSPNSGTGPAMVHPISLNNLPFNSTSNSVDECLSGGAQNVYYEGRDSSLMSPVEMAQLEFTDLFPYRVWTAPPPDNPPETWKYPPGENRTHWQYMTFTRTDAVQGKNSTFHPDMVLHTGRDGQGQYEPKVANGYGYYVTVAPSPYNSPQNTHEAGFWKWLDIGLVDVEDPNISEKHPYYIRLGINYKSTTQDGTSMQAPPPDGSWFTILRGYKSYIGGGVWTAPTFGNGKPNTLFNYWTQWAPGCTNLDELNRDNVPWEGNNYKAGCPGHNSEHPEITLTPVSNISDLLTKNPDGTYTPVLDKFYYNKDTGYLWLNIVQKTPNPATAPSPVGSCDPAVTGGKVDPACPDTAHDESYYACPKAGCITYTIAVQAPPGSTSSYTYTPGPSTGEPAAASLMAPPPATSQNQLVLYNTNTVVDPVLKFDKQNVPYHTASASTAPVCKFNQTKPGG